MLSDERHSQERPEDRESAEARRWRELKAAYDRRLRAYLARVAQREEDIRDLIEDIWASAYGDLALAKPDDEIWPVLMEHAEPVISKYRGWTRRAVHEEADHFPTSESVSEAQELALIAREDWVVARLPHLSPRQHAVIENLYLRGMTTEECAAAMRIAESTVRVHLLKAAEALRRLAEQYPPPPHEWMSLTKRFSVELVYR